MRKFGISVMKTCELNFWQEKKTPHSVFLPAFKVQYCLYWSKLSSCCSFFINLELDLGRQRFIQAFLLTSVFHGGLSFVAVGHNPMYIKVFVLADGGSNGRCKIPSSLWGAGAMPLEALAISPNPVFQIAFLSIIRWPNFFPFLGLFLPA